MDQGAFERICGGYILKGDLIGAMEYIKKVPELAGLSNRQIRETAGELFEESSRELRERIGAACAP